MAKEQNIPQEEIEFKKMGCMYGLYERKRRGSVDH